MARPSIYDERKVKRVLDLVADGASIDQACKRVRLKTGTFASWVARDYNGLAPRFYAALQAKYLVELDRTVALADSVLGSNSLPQVVAAKNAGDARRFIGARIIREFHNTEHLQVDHRKVEVHLYLPKKDMMQKYNSDHVVEGQARVIEDDSDDSDD